MGVNGKHGHPAKDIGMEISESEVIKEFSDEEKIRLIQSHFTRIMEILGLDVNDSSLKDTPKRVAKMYVSEIFSGLNARNFPEITLFENTYGYDEMLIVKDISLYSICEHHFAPIIGKVHVGYFPREKVIGLSKVNRLARFFARKPQVQEKLTMEIAQSLEEVLQTRDVAVYIEANHLCVASRGVKDTDSYAKTSYYGGRFKQRALKSEFLEQIKNTG